MKQFIINILVFTLFFIAVSQGVLALNLHHKVGHAQEVHTAIERSVRLPNKTKTVYLGDSVANQLFNSLDAKAAITSLACNQSIDMIGHYLLLDNFISQPNAIETVYFLINPFALKSDLDHGYLYHYFLKPFYNYNNLDRFTDYAINQIEKLPLSKTAMLPFMRISNLSPKHTPGVVESEVMSTTSIEYLGKIIELLKKHDIDFAIKSPPIKESRRSQVAALIERYKASAYRSKIMDDYFDAIVFLPDDFYIDNIHFKKEYIPDVRHEVISEFKKASKKIHLRDGSLI